MASSDITKAASSHPKTPRGAIPYLTVKGGFDAIDFYTKAFDAKETYRGKTKDGRLMHASLNINGGCLMLSEDMPDLSPGGDGKERNPHSLGGSPVTIHLQVEDVDAAVEQAESAGATVTFPPEDMFWGERFAKLKDPFGHEWSISSLNKKGDNENGSANEQVPEEKATEADTEESESPTKKQKTSPEKKEA